MAESAACARLSKRDTCSVSAALHSLVWCFHSRSLPSGHWPTGANLWPGICWAAVSAICETSCLVGAVIQWTRRFPVASSAWISALTKSKAKKVLPHPGAASSLRTTLDWVVFASWCLQFFTFQLYKLSWQSPGELRWSKLDWICYGKTSVLLQKTCSQRNMRSSCLSLARKVSWRWPCCWRYHKAAFWRSSPPGGCATTCCCKRALRTGRSVGVAHKDQCTLFKASQTYAVGMKRTSDWKLLSNWTEQDITGFC